MSALSLSPGNRRDSVEARRVHQREQGPMVYLPAIVGTPLKHAEMGPSGYLVWFISRQSPGLR